jgi:hypothetical protein
MSYFGIVDGIPSDGVASISGLGRFYQWIKNSGSKVKFDEEDELTRLAEDGMTSLPAVCAEQLAEMVKLSRPDEEVKEIAKKVYTQMMRCESAYGISDNVQGQTPEDDQIDPQEYVDSVKAAKLSDESMFARIFRKLTRIGK